MLTKTFIIRTRLGLGEGDLVEVAIRPLHKREYVIWGSIYHNMKKEYQKR